MIEVNNLRYTYPNASGQTIKGIDFHIGAGEIFGFLGPSGAGKSTTQKILTKILNSYSGEVSILGKALNLWDSDFYEHIGVGFELPNHYAKLTALENLEFFSVFYRSKIKDLKDLMARVGLENDMDKKTERYSKGMKMRLNFIRALMHDPQILFLDEPTSGLDPGNARLIKDIILEQKREGKTIFLTTHNMHDAEELCDRVSFIVDGELKVTDSPKRLKLAYGRRKVSVAYGSDIQKKAEFNLDNLGDNMDFLALIKQEFIAAIHSGEASLDDIFIETTGKVL